LKQAKILKYYFIQKTKTMKNLLLSIFIIIGLAACKSDPGLSNQNRDIRLLSDSTAYNNNVFSDTNTTAQAEIIPEKVSEKPQQMVRTKSAVKRTAKARTAAPSSDQAVVVPPVATTSPVSTPPIIAPAGTQSTTVDNSPATGTSQTASTGTETKVEKKKGMNKATQGAIIGGVAGAVGGAIISKKKGVGAVIGGIAGAAGGYIIGNKMDKKDNRFVLK
jgi:uncharacterized protein YcfJ